MGNDTDLSVGLSSAHEAWSRRLTELRMSEMREQVSHIEESASELGIWERGGYVPLQPFIISDAANKLLHGVGSRLKELQVDHALHRAGGDLYRLADIAEWAYDERWFLGTGRPLFNALVSARSDVLLAGGRPNFLEINIGTCLNGGTTSAVLSAALLGSPVGSDMSRAYGIKSNSYLDELVQWIRRQHSNESPNVALLGFADHGDEGSLKWADEHAARFASCGISCEFVLVDEAEISDNSLSWRGKRYEVAIRYFMVSPKMSDHLDFFGALESATATVLYGSYVSQLFTSKNLLADLYQNDRLTPDQRELVRPDA